MSSMRRRFCFLSARAALSVSVVRSNSRIASRWTPSASRASARAALVPRIRPRRIRISCVPRRFGRQRFLASVSSASATERAGTRSRAPMPPMSRSWISDQAWDSSEAISASVNAKTWRKTLRVTWRAHGSVWLRKFSTPSFRSSRAVGDPASFLWMTHFSPDSSRISASTSRSRPLQGVYGCWSLEAGYRPKMIECRRWKNVVLPDSFGPTTTLRSARGVGPESKSSNSPKARARIRWSFTAPPRCLCAFWRGPRPHPCRGAPRRTRGVARDRRVR